MVTSLVNETRHATNVAEELSLEEIAYLVSYDDRQVYPKVDQDSIPKTPVNFVEYSTAEMATAREEVTKSLSTWSNFFSSDHWSSHDQAKFDDLSSASIVENFSDSSVMRDQVEKELSVNLGEFIIIRWK